MKFIKIISASIIFIFIINVAKSGNDTQRLNGNTGTKCNYTGLNNYDICVMIRDEVEKWEEAYYRFVVDELWLVDKVNWKRAGRQQKWNAMLCNTSVADTDYHKVLRCLKEGMNAEKTMSDDEISSIIREVYKFVCWKIGYYSYNAAVNIDDRSPKKEIEYCGMTFRTCIIRHYNADMRRYSNITHLYE